jgi:hypothetical protein
MAAAMMQAKARMQLQKYRQPRIDLVPEALPKGGLRLAPVHRTEPLRLNLGIHASPANPDPAARLQGQEAPGSL